MSIPTPAGYHTVNPFIITKDALKLIEFLEKVFGAQEDLSARTMDTDGLLLHSEFKLGDSTVMVADTKPGWPFTPSLLQIYVADLAQTLQRAEALGASVVTQPTLVYGDLFSRCLDPWGNLWWVYQHQGEVTWEENTGDPAEADEALWATQSSELTYIHDTLLETMSRLGKQ